MAPIPITIITGFLGSGKTTLILKLIPQLPPDYRLALLKNEFGDLAIDSQLASASSISGVQELLNGCICCNLVGQLGDALDTLRKDVKPDRIVIETSGSAFPATLAMEVNRLGRETGDYVLDGVLVVIDVENWQGYEDTSYTAKLQARFTDMVVFNKWECAGERRFDDCLDRLGDIEVDVAWVKSDKGRVDKDVILGVDGGLARHLGPPSEFSDQEHNHRDGEGHNESHQSEVEVLSVRLRSPEPSASGCVNVPKLVQFLKSAPKDEIYRIKAILMASSLPPSSDEEPREISSKEMDPCEGSPYILNWAFGRWTFTPASSSASNTGQETLATLYGVDAATMAPAPKRLVMGMTLILARHQANKWMKRIGAEDLLELEDSHNHAELMTDRIL
ncbi:MAG: hypothetical protein M1817_003610 [Caeruleum heppii]|nr:MAG: hypothetical protein M1817_003610 [Caeruleum heppii]